MIFGYARVSTVGQDHAGQVAELKAAGADQVFAEAASGAAGRRRPQLVRAIGALGPGDLLLVTALSRLARSTRDALNILAAVAATEAGFKSLREPWADTTTPAGRLMLTVLSGFAEFDREMIVERTSAGRRTAKARGVHMGRPAMLRPDQVAFVVKCRRDVPPMSLGQLQRLLGVSRSTISRAARSGAEPGDLAAVLPPPKPRQVDLEDVIAGQVEGAS